MAVQIYSVAQDQARQEAREVLDGNDPASYLKRLESQHALWAVGAVFSELVNMGPILASFKTKLNDLERELKKHAMMQAQAGASAVLAGGGFRAGAGFLGAGANLYGVASHVQGMKDLHKIQTPAFDGVGVPNERAAYNAALVQVERDHAPAAGMAAPAGGPAPAALPGQDLKDLHKAQLEDAKMKYETVLNNKQEELRQIDSKVHTLSKFAESAGGIAASLQDSTKELAQQSTQVYNGNAHQTETAQEAVMKAYADALATVPRINDSRLGG